MTSESVQVNQFGIHYVTEPEFDSVASPNAKHLWCVEKPHWANSYLGGGVLGIVTLPTSSGDEMMIYAGTTFIIPSGRYTDGKTKNVILSITEDTIVQVADSGTVYVKDDGTFGVGTLTFDKISNKYSVDGTPANALPVIDVVLDGGVLDFDTSTIQLINLAYEEPESPIKYTAKTDGYVLEYGNGIIRQGGWKTNPSNTQYVTYYKPMKNTNYVLQYSGQSTSYSYPGVIYNSTQPTQYGFTAYVYSSYTKKIYWEVIGEEA